MTSRSKANRWIWQEVADVEFCKLWERAQSRRHMAELLGIEDPTAAQLDSIAKRALFFRSNGIPLKKLVPGKNKRPKHDFEAVRAALNEDATDAVSDARAEAYREELRERGVLGDEEK